MLVRDCQRWPGYPRPIPPCTWPMLPLSLVSSSVSPSGFTSESERNSLRQKKRGRRDHVIAAMYSKGPYGRGDQMNKPTSRPTMRWIFQCFEGIELLHIHAQGRGTTLTLRLEPLHEQVLALLGPPYQRLYHPTT